MKKALFATSAKAGEGLQGRGDEDICNFIKILKSQSQKHIRNSNATALVLQQVSYSRLGGQRHQGEFPCPLVGLCNTSSPCPDAMYPMCKAQKPYLSHLLAGKGA